MELQVGDTVQVVKGSKWGALGTIVWIGTKLNSDRVSLEVRCQCGDQFGISPNSVKKIGTENE